MRKTEPAPRKDPVPALLQIRNDLAVEHRSIGRNLEQIDRSGSVYAAPVARDWAREGEALERAIRAVSESVLATRRANFTAARDEYDRARAEAELVATVTLPPWDRITGQDGGM